MSSVQLSLHWFKDTALKYQHLHPKVMAMASRLPSVPASAGCSILYLTVFGQMLPIHRNAVSKKYNKNKLSGKLILYQRFQGSR